MGVHILPDENTPRSGGIVDKLVTNASASFPLLLREICNQMKQSDGFHQLQVITLPLGQSKTSLPHLRHVISSI